MLQSGKQGSAAIAAGPAGAHQLRPPPKQAAPANSLKQAPLSYNSPVKECHAASGRHLILVWVLQPQLVGHEGVLRIQHVGDAQPAREADLLRSRQAGHDLQAGAAALRAACLLQLSSLQ